MKNGWKTKKLGDLCETGSGGTPLKSRREYYEGGAIPWLLSGEVAQGEVRKATNFITKEGLANSSAKLFPKNTVLVAMYGATAGQVGILRFEATTNQAVCGILPNKSFVPEFLFYFLLSQKDELVAQAVGNAQPNISQIKIRNIDVPVVSLSEQQRIVGILDEAFEGIAAAKANAEKNLQNARALFESHLQSIFTRRGEGWKQKPLSSLCKLISGQHIDAKDYNVEQRGVGYLTGPSDFGAANPVVTKWTEHPKRMAKRGDILVTVKGSGVGKINLLNVEEVAISRQLMAVRARAADVSYLYAFLSTNFGYFQALSNGAAIPGISRGDVLNLMCPMPPPEEQQSIVSLIHSMAGETQRLGSIYERKLTALEALKKSLLHQAFTGNI